jgi:hypothetical protein
MVTVDSETYIGPMRNSAHMNNGQSKMTKLKTLGAMMILSAAIATPAFAQDADFFAPKSHHGRAYDQSNFRGAYNRTAGAPYDAAPLTSDEARNLQNFGFSGRDPSRVGGDAPNLNPAD